MSCLELPAPGREALAHHGAEVLRWNAQFSLISRVAPEQRLLAMQQECEAAFRALHATWKMFDSGATESASPLRYIDLGSGGGFPGLIWHAWLVHAGLPGMSLAHTLLIEPRDKRAWFLEQVALATKWQIEVRRLHWGRRQSPSVRPPAPAHDLITLKALRLTDEEILIGCRCDRPDSIAPITICRFCSAEDGNSATATEFGLGLPVGGPPGEPGAPFSLSLPFAHAAGQDALLISHYPAGA